MKLPFTAAAIGAASLTTTASAQQTPFQTPGMPNWSQQAQLDRFTNTGNPGIGAIIDAFADYVKPNGESDDGDADIFMRSFETTLNGRVDPNWWGYAVIVYADEEVELEEAAVTYTGFEGNTTMRFGRFFVDFGKQMQGHIHDLAYPERPGVLAEYLGEELPGIGVQADHWWATGDSSALRASIGVFGEFELGHTHGGEEEDEHGDDDHGHEEADFGFEDRNGPEDLGFTARVTQFMDVGERGVLQWGASARHMGGVSAAADDLIAEDLSNTVYGVDLTYGVDSDSGLSGWTFSGEALFATGDLSAEVNETDDGIEVNNDDVWGLYVHADRRISPFNSFGFIYGTYEQVEEGAPRADEVTAYWSHYFSEFSRLRFAVGHTEFEGPGGSTRALIQLTTFFGPHAHGVNW